MTEVTPLTTVGLLKSTKLRTAEKLPTYVFGSSRSAVVAAADKIASIITEKARLGQQCVLALGVDYSLSGTATMSMLPLMSQFTGPKTETKF